MDRSSVVPPPGPDRRIERGWETPWGWRGEPPLWAFCLVYLLCSLVAIVLTVGLISLIIRASWG